MALNVKQEIADNQTEVATKLATIISDNSIADANIVSVKVSKYGADRFVCVIVYKS